MPPNHRGHFLLSCSLAIDLKAGINGIKNLETSNLLLCITCLGYCQALVRYLHLAS